MKVSVFGRVVGWSFLWIVLALAHGAWLQETEITYEGYTAVRVALRFALMLVTASIVIGGICTISINFLPRRTEPSTEVLSIEEQRRELIQAKEHLESLMNESGDPIPPALQEKHKDVMAALEELDQRKLDAELESVDKVLLKVHHQGNTDPHPIPLRVGKGPS